MKKYIPESERLSNFRVLHSIDGYVVPAQAMGYVVSEMIHEMVQDGADITTLSVTVKPSTGRDEAVPEGALSIHMQTMKKPA